jgi:hypothetical protein
VQRAGVRCTTEVDERQQIARQAKQCLRVMTTTSCMLVQ